MYQLSSYYFFTLLKYLTMYVLVNSPHRQIWQSNLPKLSSSYYSKFHHVNSPYRLHSSNVAIGESGEAIHQFCCNSYHLYKILNYKSCNSTSNMAKMVQIVAIYVVAKLHVTFGVPICFSLKVA